MKSPAAALAVLLLLPVPAAAQIDNHVALGASVRLRGAPDADADGGVDIGLSWRFGTAAEGWGWSYGLNWFETTLERAIGGRSTPLGDLHVRPFMAGYGYTHVIGRVAVTADVVGGFALTSFKLNPLADDALHERLGARRIETSASSALVVKPEIGAWIDLSDRVGMNVNVGYIVARPRVTIRSSLGEDRRRYHADMMGVQLSAVYKIF